MLSGFLRKTHYQIVPQVNYQELPKMFSFSVKRLPDDVIKPGLRAT